MIVQEVLVQAGHPLKASRADLELLAFSKLVGRISFYHFTKLNWTYLRISYACDSTISLTEKNKERRSTGDCISLALGSKVIVSFVRKCIFDLTWSPRFAGCSFLTKNIVILREDLSFHWLNITICVHSSTIHWCFDIAYN